MNIPVPDQCGLMRRTDRSSNSAALRRRRQGACLGARAPPAPCSAPRAAPRGRRAPRPPSCRATGATPTGRPDARAGTIGCRGCRRTGSGSTTIYSFKTFTFTRLFPLNRSSTFRDFFSFVQPPYILPLYLSI